MRILSFFRSLGNAILFLLFTILSISICLPLNAQYNELQILTQEAYQLLARRQYNEAEQIFLQILSRNPNDANNIMQLMQIYLQTSQLDKAEELLSSYQRTLPANIHTEQTILLLIHRGNPTQAFNLAQSYLQQMNHDLGRYRLMASYFEQRSFYEQSLALYQTARSQHNDPSLFTLEIANAALNYRRLDLALSQYLQWLKLNPTNLFFVNNQVKTILRENPSLIDEVRFQTLAEDPNAEFWELYAGALQSLGQNQEALEAYKRLSADKLLRFTTDQIALGNHDIAVLSLQYLIQNSPNVMNSAELRLKLANVLYQRGDIERSKAELDTIYAISEPSNPLYRSRNSVSFLARKLMAEIQLSQAVVTDSIMLTLQDMKSYARGPSEQSEANLLIAKIQLMNSNFTEVESTLNQILDTRQYHTRDYYRVLSQILQGNADLADSLLNELIISYPESPWINDLIHMMMLVLSLPESARNSFFHAIQLFNLRRHQAVDVLLEVYAQSSDEEILILTAEWALSLGQRNRALELLAHDFSDPISSEYASLLSLSFTEGSDAKGEIARDFLSANPASVFSPGFRSVLVRSGSSRPSF